MPKYMFEVEGEILKCKDCPCVHLNDWNVGYCKINNGNISYFVQNSIKPNMCPLKEVK